MLTRLLETIIDSNATEKEKEKAYKILERMGMDRATARMLAEEIRKETTREQN